MAPRVLGLARNRFVTRSAAVSAVFESAETKLPMQGANRVPRGGRERQGDTAASPASVEIFGPERCPGRNQDISDSD